MLAPLAVVLVLLGVWELVVRVGLVDELLLPAPTQVAQALWEDRELLAPDLLVTTYEVVAGLAAALVLGVGARGRDAPRARGRDARCGRSWSARRRCRSR